MKYPGLIFLLIIWTSPIFAVLRQVPADYQTVQAGINAAQPGDTVLVQPGTYEEHLDFLSKSITVASRMIFTGSPADRDSTIIDGTLDGPCILIENVERNDAVVYGLTIQHGVNNYGGGIQLSESVATISNCLIRHNTAIDIGGGVASLDSDIYMEYTVIRENETDNSGGGGMYLRGGYSALWWCDISYNATDITDGGGLYCTDSNPIITNCTIAYNRVDSRGGGVFFTGGVRTTIRNTIMWGNDPQQLWLAGENWITVSYSDLEGGAEEIVADHVDGYINFADGNMDLFPQFVNRREFDLHLIWENFPIDDDLKSPCIDMGDPDSPLDPDQTQADLGAYYYDQPPLLSASPETLYFEELIPGFSDWQPVIVENVGGGLLNLSNQTIVSDDSPFSIGRGSEDAVIRGGAPHETWINFFPRYLGVFEAVYRAETNLEEHPVIEVVLSGATLGIESKVVGAPASLAIERIYPNPVNSGATVCFTLPQAGWVDLRICNLRGQTVEQLSAGELKAGLHRLRFDALEYPTGIYFVRLTKGEVSLSRKILLVR